MKNRQQQNDSALCFNKAQWYVHADTTLLLLFTLHAICLPPSPSV